MCWLGITTCGRRLIGTWGRRGGRRRMWTRDWSKCISPRMELWTIPTKPLSLLPHASSASWQQQAHGVFLVGTLRIAYFYSDYIQSALQEMKRASGLQLELLFFRKTTDLTSNRSTSCTEMQIIVFDATNCTISFKTIRIKWNKKKFVIPPSLLTYAGIFLQKRTPRNLKVQGTSKFLGDLHFIWPNGYEETCP